MRKAQPIGIYRNPRRGRAKTLWDMVLSRGLYLFNYLSQGPYNGYLYVELAFECIYLCWCVLLIGYDR